MRWVSLSCVVLALAFLVGFSGPASGGGGGKKDKGVDAGKGATALVFEIYKEDSKAQKYRYRIKNNEGVNLGGSTKGYTTRDECLRVVEQIKKLAGSAKIVDAAPKKK